MLKRIMAPQSARPFVGIGLNEPLTEFKTDRDAKPSCGRAPGDAKFLWSWKNTGAGQNGNVCADMSRQLGRWLVTGLPHDAPDAGPAVGLSRSGHDFLGLPTASLSPILVVGFDTNQ
jgi:hypothetical protein